MEWSVYQVATTFSCNLLIPFFTFNVMSRYFAELAQGIWALSIGICCFLLFCKIYFCVIQFATPCLGPITDLFDWYFQSLHDFCLWLVRQCRLLSYSMLFQLWYMTGVNQILNRSQDTSLRHSCFDFFQFNVCFILFDFEESIQIYDSNNSTYYCGNSMFSLKCLLI